MTTLPASPGLEKSGEHPEHLSEMDRSYIVGWGNREVQIVSFLAVAASLALIALAIGGSMAWLLGLPIILSAGALGVLFFRNPRRDVPAEPGVLVAPADGTIWDVTRLETADFVDEPCVCVGIFLSIFSVHVNRAPSRGRVEWMDYRPGQFHDARSAAAARENESNSIGIVCEEPGAPDGIRFVVKQISGAVARRIICPLGIGASVTRGGLLGMIKYGSRTELYIPERLEPEIRVKVGDKVSGGQTILATWRPADLTA